MLEGFTAALLEGSWVVISAVVSPLIWVVIMVTPLITPLTTTRDPLSAIQVWAFSKAAKSSRASENSPSSIPGSRGD